MSQSRMKNSAKNAVVGFVLQVISMVLGFVSRKLFIDYLGLEYLGVNGLFTNVLTILSFAELGIGNAIIFSLYKPLAEGNKPRLQQLMRFYATAYKMIAAIIAVCGLLVIPFFQFIINDTPQITESIIFIYLLFLANTVMSYLFIYKKSLIIADQKDYIVIFWDRLFSYLAIVLHILILIYTRNFILYLISGILVSLVGNLFIAKKADKMYPFLKYKTGENLDKTEQKNIFTNVKALLLYKIGSVSLNGTDNIIISAMIGVASVGLTSNYLLIITSVSVIIGQITCAFTAPIGNLNALSDNIKKESVFNQLFLFLCWLCGFVSIGMLLLSDSIIALMFGAEYQIDFLVVFALILHYYINSVHNVNYTYRTTMGLYVKGKCAPLVAAIVNIGLSILFANLWGLAGIFFATSAARLITTSWVDPYLIYKHKFQKSSSVYFVKYITYFLVVVINGFVNYTVLSFIKIDGVFGFLIKFTVCCVLANLIFLLAYFKTKAFKEIIKSLKILLDNVFKRRRTSEKI